MLVKEASGAPHVSTTLEASTALAWASTTATSREERKRSTALSPACRGEAAGGRESAAREETTVAIHFFFSFLLFSRGSRLRT